jgi:hypothetical protein
MLESGTDSKSFSPSILQYTKIGLSTSMPKAEKMPFARTSSTVGTGARPMNLLDRPKSLSPRPELLVGLGFRVEGSRFWV